jgi:hypothetical protein
MKSLVAAVAALFCAVPAGGEELPNEVFSALVQQGVLIGNATVHLPPPTLPDGLDAAGQKRALEQLADSNRPLDALMRNSVVAPLVLKISDDKTPGAGLTGTARRVDVWFIVHGEFARIISEDFLLGQITPDTRPSSEKADFRGETLTADQLTSRSIVAANNERLFHVSFNLFDRVLVSATSQAMLTRGDSSALVAGRIDPRFETDRQWPNRWQSLKRDDLSRLQTGPAQPYRSAAWYLKVTKLQQPAGANLVEYHILFDEPYAWFEGANLLRSKLPLVVQDAVRRFRRKAVQ